MDLSSLVIWLFAGSLIIRLYEVIANKEADWSTAMAGFGLIALPPAIILAIIFDTFSFSSVFLTIIMFVVTFWLVPDSSDENNNQYSSTDLSKETQTDQSQEIKTQDQNDVKDKGTETEIYEPNNLANKGTETKIYSEENN